MVKFEFQIMNMKVYYKPFIAILLAVQIFVACDKKEKLDCPPMDASYTVSIDTSSLDSQITTFTVPNLPNTIYKWTIIESYWPSLDIDSAVLFGSTINYQFNKPQDFFLNLNKSNPCGEVNYITNSEVLKSAQFAMRYIGFFTTQQILSNDSSDFIEISVRSFNNKPIKSKLYKWSDHIVNPILYADFPYISYCYLFKGKVYYEAKLSTTNQIIKDSLILLDNNFKTINLQF